jgi:hypothetical protein
VAPLDLPPPDGDARLALRHADVALREKDHHLVVGVVAFCYQHRELLAAGQLAELRARVWENVKWG